MANMCDDGFQLVSRHKAASRKLSKLSRKEQEYESSSSEINIKPEAVAAKLEKYKVELANSEFLSGVKEILFHHDLLSPCDLDDVCNEEVKMQSQSVEVPVAEMVLYGLGNFSTCPIACYQFAFFMLMSECLKVPNKRCFLYDPRFRTCEKDVIKQLGFCLIHVNEVGKRQSRAKTLYYMPHCGNALYNNLLWANWRPEALQNTIIMGNSFQTLGVRLPSKLMQKEFSYIYRILPFTTELELRNCFVHRDIFNDTSLHSFLKSDAAPIDDSVNEMWVDVVEPTYDGSDHGNEIISTEEEQCSAA